MKKLVKWGLKRLGYRLVRTPERWYALPDCPRPRTVIDVGCAESTPALHVAFPDARYLLVDPVAEYEPAMRHLVDRHGGSCVIAAAAEAPGEAVIDVDLEDPRKSSLFDRSALTARPERRRVSRSVQARTVDEIVRTTNEPGPYVLKIDTEGNELNVLRGACDTLEACWLVIAEVSLQERFHGSYRFFDLLSFMDRAGFEVGNVLTAPKPGSMVKFLDIAFVRKADAPAPTDAAS